MKEKNGNNEGNCRRARPYRGHEKLQQVLSQWLPRTVGDSLRKVPEHAQTAVLTTFLSLLRERILNKERKNYGDNYDKADSYIRHEEKACGYYSFRIVDGFRKQILPKVLVLVLPQDEWY